MVHSLLFMLGIEVRIYLASFFVLLPANKRSILILSPRHKSLASRNTMLVPVERHRFAKFFDGFFIILGESSRQLFSSPPHDFFSVGAYAHVGNLSTERGKTCCIFDCRYQLSVSGILFKEIFSETKKSITYRVYCIQRRKNDICPRGGSIQDQDQAPTSRGVSKSLGSGTSVVT